MKAIVKTLLLSAIGVVAFAMSAPAADLIEPIPEPIPEVVPVEVGSGWYLRGDVSYDFKSNMKAGYRTYSSSGGCSSECSDYTYDHQDYDSFKIKSGVDVGVGAGYQFTDYFRGDLTAHYWEHKVSGHDTSSAGCGGVDLSGNSFPDDSTCRSVDESRMRAWELMANAYVDVGTFAGFTPYVGGGLGAANIKYSSLTNTAYCVQSGVDCGVAYGGSVDHEGESSWRFAYALMAGVSYDISRSLKLDLGYRYVNVDGGKMFAFDRPTRAEGATGTQGEDDGFDRHTIQVGLRYSLF